MSAPSHAADANLPSSARRVSARIGGHRRVRHARRRREGEGAQGRRAAGHRLRCRRARLPDPRLHRRRGRRGLPRTRPTTATPRPAACRSSRRRSPRRPCATPATTSSRARCWSPTAASRRSTRRSRRCSTRATRCSLPAPYWTTYPESIRLAGGVPVEVLADETQDYMVTVEQLEAARTDRTKVLLFCSPSNPTGAVYDRAEVEAIGRWALEHGLWVVTDEIYEHLMYDGAGGAVDAGGRARAGRHLRRRQRGGQDLRDDRLAGRLADRPEGRRQGRDQPAVARDLQRRPTWRSAPRSPRCPATCPPCDEMGTAFDRRRRTIVSMLNEIDGVVCPEPKGAFYAYPSVKGVLGRRSTASPRPPRPSSPS